MLGDLSTSPLLQVGIKNLKNNYKNVDIYFLGQGQVALNEEKTLKAMKIPGVEIKKHYNVNR